MRSGVHSRPDLGTLVPDTLLAHSGIHPRGDDRYPQTVSKLFIERCADDDVGVGIDLLPNPARRLVDFVERQVAATRD